MSGQSDAEFSTGLLCGLLRISAFSALKRHLTQRPQRYAKGRRGKRYYFFEVSDKNLIARSRISSRFSIVPRIVGATRIVGCIPTLCS